MVRVSEYILLLFLRVGGPQATCTDRRQLTRRKVSDSNTPRCQRQSKLKEWGSEFMEVVVAIDWEMRVSGPIG